MKKVLIVGPSNLNNMTVEEVIEHCNEVAKEQNYCTECAKQHIQLAVWLEELQGLRKFKHDVARAFTPK
jgi:ribosomal protein L29